LLVLRDPVELLVVTRAKIAHHMFVLEEEQEYDRIVEFVHLLEVWYLIEMANVDNGGVLNTVRNT
jgi:hypothetical protein